ncbi:DEAD/DEAH box helicase [Halalkalibacterium halodurans]|uniref:DEAD/DEAH box helicase n=1 Tax=Halalkalibacterium halodurans TaxID=86665 RepID=UPI0006A98BEB|nr:SNF2-related protein [Halalkalibacterium halodurans]MDY7221472.1 SNF2-related protein [Halalkalibacterium halodurans]MDY7240711.1 SNF2-related protein [Halalkalibacterium halodurans]TPE67953.1 DEAD/DEAH box helicase [Halalkalibacterium halodurans]
MNIIPVSKQQKLHLTKELSPLKNIKLKLQSQAIQLQKGFDRLICLDEVYLEPRPWQYETAIKVLRDMQGSAILADEVGLGKTIEAGLIIKELLVRGLINSVLILVPAPLVEQWRDEMNDKFKIQLTDLKEEGWEEQNLLISSMPYLVRSKKRQEIINKRTFDLLVVDEAHCLKNHRTQTYKFVYTIQKNNTLLMSATPIQNDMRELFNLVNILKPGFLKSRKKFREQFIVNRYTPKNIEALRDLLNKVMIRHRRSDTLVELPRRVIRNVEIELTEIERNFHNGVIDFCRDTYKKYMEGDIQIGWDKTRVHLIVLILLSLLKQNCSSPQASLSTLRTKMFPRLDGVDKKNCLDLIQLGERITAPSKAIELLKLLKQSDEQAIVYSEYRATIDLLSELLEEHDFTVTTYHGRLSSREKQQSIERFKNKEAQVFISSESGGQGLNLQFCHRLINFDLPWNPMRIEQRIGRVHRFGQVNDVEIYTMPTKGAIDEYLLYTLTSKVNLFEVVIGELDTILSYMKNNDESFELRIGKIILESKNSAEVEEQLRSISDEFLTAKQELDQDVDQATKILNTIGVGT